MSHYSRRRAKMWAGGGLLIALMAWGAYSAFRHEVLSRQLVAAVKSHNSAGVGRTLALGADADARDYAGTQISSAQLAGEAHNRLLQIRGGTATTGVSALARAVAENDFHSAMLLLHAGATDVDAYVREERGDTEGPLIVVAARHGDAPLVDALASRGARVDARSIDTFTALLIATLAPRDRDDYTDGQRGEAEWRAARTPYEDVVHVLLQRGANPNLPTGAFSVLQHWIDTDDEKVVDDLLAHGADPNITDHYDDRAAEYTPLSRAIQRESRHIITALVAHGARINDTGGADGASPLMWASHYHDTWTVRFLLDHGADANLLNRSGHNALYYVRAFETDGETGGPTVNTRPLPLDKELPLLLQRYTKVPR